MNKEFVPYEIALRLKELGFNTPCIMFYDNLYDKSLRLGTNDEYWGDYTGFINWNGMQNSPWKPFGKLVSAPLWQQAFDWFREQYNLFVEVKPDLVNVILNLKWSYRIINLQQGLNIDNLHYYQFNSYEEAKLECLKKLIELCQEQKEDTEQRK